jgi:hypothetical protein
MYQIDPQPSRIMINSGIDDLDVSRGQKATRSIVIISTYGISPFFDLCRDEPTHAHFQVAEAKRLTKGLETTNRESSDATTK